MTRTTQKRFLDGVSTSSSKAVKGLVGVEGDVSLWFLGKTLGVEEGRSPKQMWVVEK